jgi:hypothetical protein
MPQRVSGQPKLAGADTAKRVWVSVALGPSTANTREFSSTGQLLGADLSAWLTRDKLAFGIRTAWASEFYESDEVHDVAALAGIHAHNEPHVDAVAGLGVGFSKAHGNLGANRRTMPVLAAGAQLVFNYRFVGIGLDGFGGLGRSRRYYGVGLALAFGRFPDN